MGCIVTLTTDFGISDAYVGIMKGVILRIAPEATIVDISHDVAAQDVAEGSFLLASAYRYFPQGTVHVGVVDPGVGTSRRPIAMASDGLFFVGPDNGLFSFLLVRRQTRDLRAVHLTERSYWLPEPSATFQGRDIFAPVAAHLSLGVQIEELGPEIPISSLKALPAASARRRDDVLEAQVVHVDRFGNLITNIVGSELRRPDRLVVEIAGQRIGPLSQTYADAEPGQLLLLIGSTGYLEIAVSSGNAASQLAVRTGEHLHAFDGISAH